MMPLLLEAAKGGACAAVQELANSVPKPGL
jgi:hypothetical protein